MHCAFVWIIVGGAHGSAPAQTTSDQQPRPGEPTEAVRAAGGANDTSYSLPSELETTVPLLEGFVATLAMGTEKVGGPPPPHLKGPFEATIFLEAAVHHLRTNRQKGQMIQKMVEDLFSLRRVPSVITLTGRYLTDSDLHARAIRFRYSDVANSFDVGIEWLYINPDIGTLRPISGVGLFTKVELYHVRGAGSRQDTVNRLAQALMKFENNAAVRSELAYLARYAAYLQGHESYPGPFDPQKIPTVPPRYVNPNDLFNETRVFTNRERTALQTVRDALDALRAELKPLFEQAIRTERRAKIALAGAHYVLHDIGSETDAGIVASKLFPCHLAPTLAVEHVRSDPQDFPNNSAWRVSSALTWQDRVPFTYKETEKEVSGTAVKMINIPRWRWMLGVGYTFKNPVDKRFSSVVFVRHRPPHPYGLEFSGFVGHSRRDTTIVGVSVQRAFGFHYQTF